MGGRTEDLLQPFLWPTGSDPSSTKRETPSSRDGRDGGRPPKTIIYHCSCLIDVVLSNEGGREGGVKEGGREEREERAERERPHRECSSGGQGSLSEDKR